MTSSSFNIITANNLAASYKSTTIWKNATFTVSSGEFIGILGSNGAGKTTLFRLILGLMQPSEGSLSVLGETPHKGDQRISYIPQKRYLDSESQLDALEYVRLGLGYEKLGFNTPMKSREEKYKAMEALDLVDARNLAGRPLRELSGGEAQRVFLAQALTGNPQLLLLDEPLANLDIKRENQLIQLIHSVAKENNIAVLLIAHDINPLLPSVDRIIYIANQKIVAGTTEDIINSSTLSNLYNAPIEVLHGRSGRMAVLGTEEAGHHHV